MTRPQGLVRHTLHILGTCCHLVHNRLHTVAALRTKALAVGGLGEQGAEARTADPLAQAGGRQEPRPAVRRE
jgi:hypothetical protein